MIPFFPYSNCGSKISKTFLGKHLTCLKVISVCLHFDVITVSLGKKNLLKRKVLKFVRMCKQSMSVH